MFTWHQPTASTWNGMDNGSMTIVSYHTQHTTLVSHDVFSVLINNNVKRQQLLVSQQMLCGHNPHNKNELNGWYSMTITELTPHA